MHSDRIKTFFFSTGIALSCVLAACSGGDEGASSEAPEAEPRADLCALLTESDIEEVLGAAPGAPSPGDEGLGECSWGTGPSVVLSLEEASLSSFDDFVYEYGVEFGGENPPRDRFHPVDGIGDWAMYVADDHMVRAFRGDEVLEVSSSGAEEEQVVDLAKRAMSRLP